MLCIRVAATEAEPVITLSGEADLTTLAQLEETLNAQISAGARILRLEMSGLRFADSATIAALARAGRSLDARGGRLELLNPRLALIRVLTLLGADKMLVLRTGGPDGSQA
ncbi:MAG: STAS domain-containing protein [Trebonia sp.]